MSIQVEQEEEQAEVQEVEDTHQHLVQQVSDRASDGRCYALPTPPPESCPTGAYRASDGKCYPITPGQPVGDCPAGYTKGSDGICRASTACPAGYTLTNGVCVANTVTCPSGYTNQSGICVQNQITCPAGYTYSNGNCVLNTVTCPTGYTNQGGVCVQNPAACPAGYIMQNGVCIPAPNNSPLNIPLTQYSLIKLLPPGVSPSQWSANILSRDPYKVDIHNWYAVQLRPQYSGGSIQYAVIIRAQDSSEYRDAMTRAGFQPLTSDDLMRYMATSGSYAAGVAHANRNNMRRFNRRILNRYR